VEDEFDGRRRKKIRVGNNRKATDRIHYKEDEEERWVWSRNGYSVKEVYSSIVEGYVAEGWSEHAVSHSWAMVCHDPSKL